MSLDCECKQSTYAEIFEDAYPKQFFEMYIAEQNMVGAGLSLATRGKIPFVSTFAAFFLPGLRPGPHEPVHRTQPEV